MTQDAVGWRLGRRPGLDGLRGIAVVCVIGFHSPVIAPGGALGAAGVSVFFALSGFLITLLLLEEHGDTGSINLVRFYRNRALRLFPALTAMLVFVAALMVPAGFLGVGQVAAAGLYVANIVEASGGDLGMLVHTWSLATEEQFYLLWPLVVVFLARRRRALLVACVVGIGVSTALRVLLWLSDGGFSRIYYAPDTQASGLLVGCLLAVLVHRGWWRRLPTWTLGVGLAALLGSRYLVGTDVVSVLIPAVIPWLAAAMICCVLEQPPRWLAVGPLPYLGRRSYGLYLWHLPIFAICAGLSVPHWVALLTSPVVAELSWRFIEEPFLALKRRSLIPAHPTPSLRRRVEAGR